VVSMIPVNKSRPPCCSCENPFPPDRNSVTAELLMNQLPGAFSHGAWTKTSQRAAPAHAVGAKACLIRAHQCSSVSQCSSEILCVFGSVR
jgi:hypothetical protein